MKPLNTPYRRFSVFAIILLVCTILVPAGIAVANSFCKSDLEFDNTHTCCSPTKQEKAVQSISSLADCNQLIYCAYTITRSEYNAPIVPQNSKISLTVKLHDVLGFSIKKDDHFEVIKNKTPLFKDFISLFLLNGAFLN